MKRVTIKDVAREAGVSIATISRVINQTRYVSPDIERRVRAVIEASGYYPDSVARSMRNNATSLIGFIVSDISNLHFMIIARAIEDSISLRHYNLIVCSTENDGIRERDYLKALMSKKIAGLIINTTGKNDEYVARISREIPVTLVHRRIRHGQFCGDMVGFNNRKGAHDLACHLLAAGHRRIGVINGPRDISTSQERFEGWRQAMREAGLAADPALEFFGDFTMSSGREAAELLTKLAPTALLVMNNAMTIGVLKYLRSRRLRVPEDVSLVCFGDIDNGEIMYVQPTFVTQNPAVIGAKVAELMLERLADKGKLNREVIFESVLSEGNSVAALAEH